MNIEICGLFRRLVTPFRPPSNIALAVCVGPLEEASNHLGIPEVEALARSPAIRPLINAFRAFLLGDERAELAIRKAAHVALNQRMRIAAINADPPEGHGFSSGIDRSKGIHPLDRFAASCLARIDSRIQVLDRIPITSVIVAELGVLVRLVLLIAETIFIGIRFGRLSVSHRRYTIGTPRDVFGDWTPFRDAAREKGHWSDDRIFLTVIESDDDRTFTPWANYVRIDRTQVSRKDWFMSTLPRTAVLAAKVAARLATGWRNPWVVQLCGDVLSMTRDALAFERLSHTCRFSFYFDVEEYASRHIVKAAVFGRYGTCLVRWPHAQMDSPGAAMSFLGYDLFLSSGPYESSTFGETWAPSCKSRSVGMVRNDRRIVSSVEPNYARTVVEHKAKGGKVAVYFMPSVMGGRQAMVRKTLEIIERQIVTRDNWLLVIKPKGRKCHIFLDELFSVVSDFSSLRNRAVIIRYEDSDGEPFPAGWGIEQMDVGIGIGSVTFESLSRRRPFFLYYPVIHKTPATEKLVAARLMHDRPESFEAALSAWLNDPAGFDIDYDWFQSNFDPFCDDRAMTRVAELLFRSESSSAT